VTEKLLPNAPPFSRVSEDEDGATTTFQLERLTRDPRVKKLIDGYEEQMR